MPFGYGWVFPKGDHFNVGVYTSDDTVALHPDRLRAYARARFGARDCTHNVGQRVALGGWHYRPRSRQVFLVGDAAGLTEPLLGEGIYYAVKSGQAAAEAIAAELEGNARARDLFRERIRVLARDVSSASRLARCFYADVGFGYQILTMPLVTYCAVKGCAVGMTIRDVMRNFYTLPFPAGAPASGTSGVDAVTLSAQESAARVARGRRCMREAGVGDDPVGVLCQSRATLTETLPTANHPNVSSCALSPTLGGPGCRRRSGIRCHRHRSTGSWPRPTAPAWLPVSPPAKIGDGRDPLPHAWSSDGNSLVARTVAGALSIAVGRPLL